ncbi:MFS transporter [Modestobacter marinus]|uniref:MFS transporter n=1 Tax=Modestobacter marinus TaxID=477641 RepID=A0A846LYS5_9ACTN|nr:MFS transporter [Modestobacter marinus]NIH68579.1 CP family cyanate transporter-like MFS transporter [Modestobacter marinus]GGL58372.1 MFS transporter [Modestobacter marinus]
MTGRGADQRTPALLLAAVLLVGVNLRGAIAAVSPVLPEVRADLGLSPSSVSLVTTLPVLCFAAAAPAAAWFGRRVGARPGISWALLLLAVATVARVLGGPAVLLAGTVAIGLAMTVGNVLLPPVVKAGFGAAAGRVTGLYTAALAAGAALTAALTAPIAGLWGWRVGLAGWALLALAAAVLWRSAAGTADPTGPAPVTPAAAGRGPATGPSVWPHPVAWAVGLLLALQTMLYYAVTTWLPTLLVDRLEAGLPTGAAAASLFQLVGILGALLVPALIGRRRGQVGLGLVVGAGWVVLFAGLLAWPAGWGLWVTVGGLAQGAGVALSFTVIVLRAHDADAARRVSGMAQLVGYGIGATGPLLVGGLYGATGGWAVPLATLAGIGVLYAAVASVAGRPVTVGGPPSVRDGGSAPVGPAPAGGRPATPPGGR